MSWARLTPLGRVVRKQGPPRGLRPVTGVLAETFRGERRWNRIVPMPERRYRRKGLRSVFYDQGRWEGNRAVSRRFTVLHIRPRHCAGQKQIGRGNQPYAYRGGPTERAP